MPTVTVKAEDLQELFGRRTNWFKRSRAGMGSGEWDPVMRAFDGLLATDRPPGGGPRTHQARVGV